MDLLLRDGCIVTMAPPGQVLRGDVLIRDGCIVEVGGDLSARMRRPARVVPLNGDLVLPGFILAPVQLMRHPVLGGSAAADQVCAGEEKALRPAGVQLLLRLVVGQLARAGFTSLLDVGTFASADKVFTVAGEVGLRMTAGQVLSERVGSAREVRTWMAEGERLRKIWDRRGNDRLRYAYSLWDTRSCSADVTIEIVGRAREAGCPLLCRLQSDPGVQLNQRLDSVSHGHDLGLSGHDVVLHRLGPINARALKLLRETQTKLAFAGLLDLERERPLPKISDLLDERLHWCLPGECGPAGTFPSGLAMLKSLHTLACAQKCAADLAPWRLLSLMTLGGARAMGRHDEIGSLEAGKRADCIIVRFDQSHHVGLRDIATALVQRAQTADVREVFVDGQSIVRDGLLLGYDHDRVRRDALSLWGSPGRPVAGRTGGTRRR